MKLTPNNFQVSYNNNERSKVFHPSACRSAKRIINPQKATRGEAIGLGLKPCLNCEHSRSATTDKTSPL